MKMVTTGWNCNKLGTRVIETLGRFGGQGVRREHGKGLPGGHKIV